MREGSPPFNAALIGHLEAVLDDVEEQNALAPPNPYPSSAVDWIRVRHVGMIAQRRWIRRLTSETGSIAPGSTSQQGYSITPGEPGVAQAIGSYLENSDRAIENLATFRGRLGDSLLDDV